MSNSTAGGASVAVTFFLTVAATIAPGIPDEYRMKLFLATLVLLALSCAWWLWARHSSKHPVELHKQKDISAGTVSASNVASAGRDVHQTIYHGPSICAAIRR
jgi:hypothetical protein